MKVIFGIAILTAKDINAMNARINKAADMAKENEQSVAQQTKPLFDFRANSLRLWTSSAGTFR